MILPWQKVRITNHLKQVQVYSSTDARFPPSTAQWQYQHFKMHSPKKIIPKKNHSQKVYSQKFNLQKVYSQKFNLQKNHSQQKQPSKNSFPHFIHLKFRCLPNAPALVGSLPHGAESLQTVAQVQPPYGKAAFPLPSNKGPLGCLGGKLGSMASKLVNGQ